MKGCRPHAKGIARQSRRSRNPGRVGTRSTAFPNSFRKEMGRGGTRPYHVSSRLASKLGYCSAKVAKKKRRLDPERGGTEFETGLSNLSANSPQGGRGEL